MKTEQDQVKEFMLKAGQECPEKPVIPSVKLAKLRVELIQEELLELRSAIGLGRRFIAQDETERIPSDLVEVSDAITDLLVVVLGTAVACGIDIQPCWDEVHRSNMTKFIDGHRREDGKWIKGPSYSPANLEPIVKAQQNS